MCKLEYAKLLFHFETVGWTVLDVPIYRQFPTQVALLNLEQPYYFAFSKAEFCHSHLNSILPKCLGFEQAQSFCLFRLSLF